VSIRDDNARNPVSFPSPIFTKLHSCPVGRKQRSSIFSASNKKALISKETDMTDNHTEEGQPARPARRWGWGRRALVGALLIGAGMLPGFAIGAHQAAAWIWHGPKHVRFDPERMAERVDRRVDRMLSRVEATDEQKGKVSAITKAALTDLANLGVNPWDTRGKFVELLRADTIDPAALEALRAEQVGKLDAASKRAVAALTEAAAVLTPEQRKELTDRWERRHRRDR
jgi:protein CpxP